MTTTHGTTHDDRIDELAARIDDLERAVRQLASALIVARGALQSVERLDGQERVSQ